MKSKKNFDFASVISVSLFAFLLIGLPAIASADPGTLRIVSYNIDSGDQFSEDNITGPNAGLPTVLQAIGLHHIGTNAQPIDVLGLEELNYDPITRDQTSGSLLATALNNIYGSGTYAFYPIADAFNGTIGGPDGLIYNTHTVQVISATTVGVNSTSGAARQPLRYQLRPVGYGSDADFYMYVDHYKAPGSFNDTTSMNRRNVEAQTVRADADTLGPNAHIIYSGDFNLAFQLANSTGELSWQTLTGSGNGYNESSRAIDPTGATGWVNLDSSWNYLYSERTRQLDARFDLQLVNGAMLNQPGLQLAPDTSDPFDAQNFPSSKYPYAYEVFGNNGTIALNDLANAAGNTSLNDLVGTGLNPQDVLKDLMEPYAGNGNQFVGSDHLPVVADYVLVGVQPVPEPSTLVLAALGFLGLAAWGRRRRT